MSCLALVSCGLAGPSFNYPRRSSAAALPSISTCGLTPRAANCRPKEVEVIGTFQDTNWDGDDSCRDLYPTSILDLILLGGDAMDWKASSTVILRDGDFPDDERTSDHRPVMAEISP